MNTKSNFQIYNASAGSGKTFTLVKEYLKILFVTPNLYSFQNILAITFTNKAAAEMKERVLDNLMAFSAIDVEKPNNDLFLLIIDELNIEASIIKEKSLIIIKNILNNYGGFNITTIDSFTHKLIRSFAFDLGINLNFEVEMDAISLINQAVDTLISRIGEDKQLTKTLIDFSISKANEDKSWDIAKDLKEIAKLLLNENDIFYVNKIKSRSINDFIALQKNIQIQLRETENKFKHIGDKAIDIIKVNQLAFKDFIYSDLPNHFKKMSFLDLSKLNFDGRLAKNIENNHSQYSSKTPQIAQKTIEAIRDELISLYHQSEALYLTDYKTYLLNKLISKSIIPLAILKSINTILAEIKETKNIRLISEFNQLISKHLKEQPAAFIYEKIGERFQHYFIDEMQDTSIMQWENMLPLLENSLLSENITGETGSLLLVGDAKQAIYRWRGGKAEQFIDLADKETPSPFLVPKNTHNLDTNYRSYSQIIDFNNQFFYYIAKYLKNNTYNKLYELGNQQKENKNKGGYIEIQFIEKGLKAQDKLEVYPKKVLETIQKVTKQFKKKDICIITRTRKQGVAIAEYLTKEKIPIISSETLLLQNSPKVTFIINLLNYIKQPKDKEVLFEIVYFLNEHLNFTTNKHPLFNNLLSIEDIPFFEKLQSYELFFDLSYFKNLSLYESVEYIIRTFKLTHSSDAYLQFFLDVILDFSLKTSEGMNAFLNYWEEKKDSLSIVASKELDAINIMTIHKSKGLEFPVVIYPFDLDIYKQINPKVWYHPLESEKYNGFDTALINYNQSLKEISDIGEQIYIKQQQALELDNFNLAYVVFTRAKEQLYIINEIVTESDEPKSFAHLLISFLKHKEQWKDDQTVYHFGDPQRKSKKLKDKQKNVFQKKFISSDWRQHNINIIPSTNTIEESSEKARQFGNLIHLILSQINYYTEVETVIANFIRKGLIDINHIDTINKYILNVINHPQLKDYFTEKYTIINEREIRTDLGEIIIPDRLVFNKNEVVIIDYKTGKPEKKYHQQITNYGNALKKMNYKIKHKILIYIDEHITLDFVN